MTDISQSEGVGRALPPRKQAPVMKSTAGSSGASYRADELGIVTELQTKRAAAVERLSPAARHAAFPTVYAKPVPFDRGADHERQELHRLRLENTNLKAKISGLEVHVERLLVTQDKMAVQVARRITVNDAFPAASVERIVNTVAKHWDVTPANLRSHSRVRQFSWPRHAAYRLILDFLNLSTPNIGRYFGSRDHTTVLSGLKKARRLRDNNLDWRTRYDAALDELKSAGTERAGAP